MKTSTRSFLFVTFLGTACAFQAASAAGEQFHGDWALTLPGGGAGWLGVEDRDGQPAASLLWGGGSVVPMRDISLAGDTLVIKRVRKPRGRKGSPPPKPITDTITATRHGDSLRMAIETGPEGSKPTRSEFTGTRTPPPPEKPELSKATLGKPVVLFDGSSLDGWTLTNPGQTNGWSIMNGELHNDPKQPAAGRHLSYGNLRTVQEFEDFNLKLDVNVGEKGNSGVYLRGIYEIQVSDSHGMAPDSHRMGGVYSRISPSINAAKPAGEWQTLDITLLDRHVNVILNGRTVIDNAPVRGCTGGALWSDPFKPGPIYLQGDHSAIRYRNIVLTPITMPRSVSPTTPIPREP
jgi:hypothetical protein